MNKLNITSVQPSLIDVMWSQVSSHISRVIEKTPDELTLECLKRDLKNNNQILVIIADEDQVIAVNILRIVTFDTGIKALYIPITGGDRMDEWLDEFMSMAHKFAAENGCSELRGLACRKGWLRKLESYDWYSIHEIIGCKVKNIEE